MNIFKTVSLFSGAGFGDKGFQSAGLSPVLLAEIEPRRAQLSRVNFPHATVLSVDVSSAVPQIAASANELLNGDELFLLTATPPCQGMSKNGIGTLLRSKERGLRPHVDPRNRLYLPALELVELLQPRWFFFENVCRMMNTFDIGEDGRSHAMCSIIENKLRSLGYSGSFEQVQLADYGLPQTRLRTVGIFRRTASSAQVSYMPPPSHSRNGSARTHRWVSLREAVGDLPSLDSKNRKVATSSYDPLHRVPVWRGELYSWMAATPEGCSALDNTTCAACELDNGKTVVECVRCGEPLSRPSVNRKGKRRLIRGFPSAYKRMFWDKPASTVTTRSAYACSDHKVHPDQNRVLTTLEVALLQGIDPCSYQWGTKADSVANDTLLRDVIGECVPPMFATVIGKHLLALDQGRVKERTNEVQIPMFQIESVTTACDPKG